MTPDEKLEAQLSAIRTAIDDAGVSTEFTESREYEHIVDNFKALMDSAWAEGYSQGLADESLAQEAQERSAQKADSLSPSADRPYRNIPLDKGDLDP